MGGGGRGDDSQVPQGRKISGCYTTSIPYPTVVGLKILNYVRCKLKYFLHVPLEHSICVAPSSWIQVISEDITNIVLHKILVHVSYALPIFSVW